ncbi:MAG: MoaD/ThiS family protein [Nocardioidaceae bacterium]
MSANTPGDEPAVGGVTSDGAVRVRYWAAARAAAGTDGDVVPVGAGATLGEVLDAVLRMHPDRPRLATVLPVCSVLVGDRPVTARDPDTVRVSAGDTVELLPPFAGG